MEGYTACSKGISRSRNPYADKPVDDKYSDVKAIQFLDWHNGWNKRFYQENLHSDP